MNLQIYIYITATKWRFFCWLRVEYFKKINFNEVRFKQKKKKKEAG